MNIRRKKASESNSLDLNSNCWGASYLFFIFLTSLFLGCNSSSTSDFLFTHVPEGHSKIKFRNVILEDKLTNSFFYEYVYNGGGVAVGDLNNDGLADIYFTSNLHNNALYLNQGNLKFKDITATTSMGGKQRLDYGCKYGGHKQ